MFYLFILESIGTSELLMIGLIALIVFGPRKLPEMMRMIGKTMAEFRRSTDDFKRTWEKEVNFEDEIKSSENPNLLLGNQPMTGNVISRNSDLQVQQVTAPEIREVSQEDFSSIMPKIETPINEEVKTEINSADKRNWL